MFRLLIDEGMDTYVQHQPNGSAKEVEDSLKTELFSSLGAWMIIK